LAVSNKQRVFVIGHKNPDTDSVCSAIAYSYFKNILDKERLYIPARAGELNEETRFVLERFGVPAPLSLESLVATVSDMELSRPISVFPDDSIYKLALLVKDHNLHTVPVIDSSRRLVGVVGVKDIANHYAAGLRLSDIQAVPVNVDSLLETLEARIIANPRQLQELKGRIFIAAMERGTVLNQVQPGDVVILGDQFDLQVDLIEAGCSALIITDGTMACKSAISLAEERGTLLISSSHPAFTTAKLLSLSAPLATIMRRDVLTVGLTTPISVVRKRIIESEDRSLMVVDGDQHLIGIISRSDILMPIRKRAILVDHNEKSQAADGIEETEVLEIIDHHRVGDISTLAPIYVYNDPIGSTTSVVAGMMFLFQVKVTADIAGVLLAGILSDTLLLSLSTTTPRDREAAERLAVLAGVDMMAFGQELLRASIRIEGRSASEIIAADFKESFLGGNKIGVGQTMVLDSAEAGRREEEFLAELERLRLERGYDLVVLLITNPLEAGRERVLMKGATWLVEKAFGVSVVGDTCYLPGVLSRKKDFIPRIGLALSQG
jgi:manganese-dependent inorganic pyrophosphatase